MKNKRLWYSVAAALIAGLLLGGVVWMVASRSGSDTSSGSRTSQGSGTTSQKTSPETQSTGNKDGGTPQPQTYPVSVYFSKHPESDNDPFRVFPVQRISPDLGEATFALRELIRGPSATELTQGYFTTIGFREGAPTCADDFKLTITDGAAKLQFCWPFDHRGVVADGQADSELKATLQQFDTV